MSDCRRLAASTSPRIAEAVSSRRQALVSSTPMALELPAQVGRGRWTKKFDQLPLGSYAELAEDRGEVVTYRALAQEQQLRDRGHPVADHQSRDDFEGATAQTAQVSVSYTHLRAHE